MPSIPPPPFIPKLQTLVLNCASCAFGRNLSVLDEANVLALFPEALTADVQAVLADQTGLVGADAAIQSQFDCSKPNLFPRDGDHGWPSLLDPKFLLFAYSNHCSR
jgi:hypothetical protein